MWRKFIGLLALVLFGVPLAASLDAAERLRVSLPNTAPGIISDYRSWMGANGLRRPARHQGIDIPGPVGFAVIAAADGKVIETDIGPCWGPTVVIDHGLGKDGQPLIAAYGHLGQIHLREGQRVRRGQVVGTLDNSYRKFKCTAAVRHVHFQLGRQYRGPQKGSYWGHVRYLVDGKKGVNPHFYWADGPGKVTCFKPGQTYPKGTLTYPARCE